MEKNTDSGRIELEAMRQVLETLSLLPDDGARARVLRWAGEHLTISPSAGVADSRPMPVTRLSSPETADLELEGLESLFESEAPAGVEAGGADASAEQAVSKKGVLKGFQRPNRDRQSA